MAILNEKNDFTKGTIHLMITDKCNRRCPDCCNNQYNISDIPVATSKDFIEAKHVYLTGGEPFAYGDPCLIAERLKMYYPNIEKIIVYTNALELYQYLNKNELFAIDGLTISIKNSLDAFVFNNYLSKDKRILSLNSNRLYVFEGFENVECPDSIEKMIRTWQKEFIAAPGGIFRRAGKWDFIDDRG